jgi:hypothetical protein
MTIYTAYFRTDADYAEKTFEANAAAQALALARTFDDEHKAGCELSDVVKAMVWLREHVDFSGFNAFFAEYLACPWPTAPVQDISIGFLSRRLQSHLLGDRAKTSLASVLPIARIDSFRRSPP